MNTYELDTLSLQYIRRPVDDAARRELSFFFVAAYNEIYRRIMSEAYRLYKSENVVLDNNHSFFMNSLATEPISIKYIESLSGEKLLWERGPEVTVKVRTTSPVIKVSYYYMPETLENNEPTIAPTRSSDLNTPVIPKEYHNIFSLWAAYRYLHSRRKFEDANCYYEMAIELFLKLKTEFSEKVKINVNYLN